MMKKEAFVFLFLFVLCLDCLPTNAASIASVEWNSGFWKQVYVKVSGDPWRVLYIGCEYVTKDGEKIDVEPLKVSCSREAFYYFPVSKNAERIIFTLWKNKKKCPKKNQCDSCRKNGYHLEGRICSSSWIKFDYAGGGAIAMENGQWISYPRVQSCNHVAAK